MAEVEGDIEDIDGVIRITAIRVHYKATIPPGTREKAERALEVYAEKCPAYVTVKDCLQVTSTAELKEA